MLTTVSIWFLIILVLGIVANVTALKTRAFVNHSIWFWNVVWVVALYLTWSG